MIDPRDTATGDLVGDFPKRRGRPPTGNAKSGAERMRAMRNRDNRAIACPKDMTTTGLLELLAWAVSGRHIATFEMVSEELRRRMKSSQ